MRRFWRGTSGRKLLNAFGAALSVAIFCLALVVLWRALRRFEFADVMARLSETPPSAVALALLSAAASYLVLAGFDWLGIRYVRRHVPVGTVVLTSFISHAISHSAGFAALTGGSIRYRMYSAAGLSVLEVAAVVVFCGLTFMVGAATIAAVALLVHPHLLAEPTGASAQAIRMVGVALLAVVAAYLAAGALLRGPVRLFGRWFRMPPPGIAGGQVVVAALDLSFAAGALYAVLPAGEGVSLPAIVAIYVLANLAGIAAHVPGGLGVFETAVVLMLPGLPADAVLGALLIYRFVYNLLPLIVGAALLGVYEAVVRREKVRLARSSARLWLRELEPQALAGLCFAAGALLVISGALPDDPARLERLADALPAAVPQAAHMLASAVGVGLLLTAHGLYGRLASAHFAASVLLALGAAAALLRGLDGVEAALLSLLLALLLAAREGFYRAAPATSPLLAPGWTGAAAVMVIAAGWIAVSVFRSADYDAALFLDFSLDAAPARSLRGVAAAALVLAGVVAALPWRRRAAPPARPPADDREAAAAIVARSPVAAARRALLGDLSLMLSENRRAFLAYAEFGSLWVAVGEPVGEEREWLDLAWRFREVGEASGAETVFLHVPARPLYLDMGLSFARIGAEARLPLPRFSFAAPERAELRRLHALAAAGGAEFAVVPPGEARGLLGDSDDAGDVPLALVRRDGRAVAAAPVWLGAGRVEMTLDCLRVEEGAGRGIEDFLVAEAVLWGRGQGCQWFDFGLLPDPAQDEPARVAELRRLIRPLLPRRHAHRRLVEAFHPQWRTAYAAMGPSAALSGGVAELLGLGGPAGGSAPGLTP